MIASLRHFLGWMVSAFRSREDLVLENLALRQQLLALERNKTNGKEFVSLLSSDFAAPEAGKERKTLELGEEDPGHGPAY